MTDEEYEKEYTKEFGGYTGNTYAMFTLEGAKAVEELVIKAKATKKYTFNNMLRDLAKLANSDKSRYGEATDTAVRESVGITLGFYK
jgi:hypothetical protein